MPAPISPADCGNPTLAPVVTARLISRPAGISRSRSKKPVMKARLEKALTQIPALQGPEVSVQPLEGGITNRNFLVEPGPLVLRLGGDNSELLGIDRDMEHTVTAWAAQT